MAIDITSSLLIILHSCLLTWYNWYFDYQWSGWPVELNHGHGMDWKQLTKKVMNVSELLTIFLFCCQRVRLLVCFLSLSLFFFGQSIKDGEEWERKIPDPVKPVLGLKIPFVKKNKEEGLLQVKILYLRYLWDWRWESGSCLTRRERESLLLLFDVSLSLLLHSLGFNNPHYYRYTKYVKKLQVKKR